MLIEFNESIELPVEVVYPIFQAPQNWPQLYGAFGEVEDRGDGWHAVPLRAFPFPLVARITRDEPLKTVGWEFKGFWKGEAEVSFSPTDSGVQIRGFERISVRPLWRLSPLVESLFLERRFRAIWSSGWPRLRRLAGSPNATAADQGY